MKTGLISVITLFLFAICAGAKTGPKTIQKPTQTKNLKKKMSSTSNASEELIRRLELSLKSNPDKLSVRENLAHSYFRKSNFKKVITLLNAYQDELSNRGLVDLSKAFSEEDQLKRSLGALNLLLERKSKNYQYYFMIAKVYFKISKIKDQQITNSPMDRALESLRKATLLKPKHRPLYDMLLKIYASTKSYYETVTLTNVMLGIFGEQPELMTGLCKAYYKQQFVDQTIEACKKAILISPKTPENHIYLSSAYMSKNKKPLARKILVTAGKKFKKSLFVQLTLGKYFYDATNYPTSLRYYTQASRVDSKSALAHLGVARSKFETEDYEGALKSFLLSCENDVRLSKWIEAARTRIKSASSSYQLQSKYNMAVFKCKQSGKKSKRY